MRWAIRLQQSDFELVYRQGKGHLVFDNLLRTISIGEVIVTDPESENDLTTTDNQYNKMLQVNE